MTARVVVVPADGLDAARQIIAECEKKGAPVKLFGGLAFRAIASEENQGRFARANNDIDLMAHRDDIKKIVEVMHELGFQPREMFNRLNLGKRLVFYDMKNRRRLDIFLDEFNMCHKFNFRDSIDRPGLTLPVTDLLITKLQVVEATEKELKDLMLLFTQFELTDGEGGINKGKIVGICSMDWRVYKTFRLGLARLEEYAKGLSHTDATTTKKIEDLTESIEKSPKSLAWKVRSLVGERVRWYELPESDADNI